MRCVLTLKMRTARWITEKEKMKNNRISASILFLIAQSLFEIQSLIRTKTRHGILKYILYRSRGHISNRLKVVVIQLRIQCKGNSGG